jgi:hypothetical protein
MALKRLSDKVQRALSTSATVRIGPSTSRLPDEARVEIGIRGSSTSFVVPLGWIESTNIGAPIITAFVEHSTESLRAGSI